MNTNAVEKTLIVASALFALTAWARWHGARPIRTAPAAQQVPARRPAHLVSDSMLEAAVDRAVTNDPFRLSNTPPDARFDPARGAVQAVAAFTPPPVRPVFALKAIVGGPPWQAVIDGIPGEPPGTLTREGSEFDKLVVRSVTRDSVIIQGPDTSWVLRFGRRP